MTSLLTRILGKRATEAPPALKRHLELKKRLDPKTPIAEVEFTVFDTELTGLDFKRDSIISIGAVQMKGGSIYPAKTFYRLAKPESALRSESVVIHEITHSDLDGAEEIGSALHDFIEFIGDTVLVGHFVYIDVNFVNKALKSLYGITLQSPAVDTSALHDWLYENDSRFAKHHGGMSLKGDLFTLAKAYGIPLEKSHNAFYDAYVTAQLFQRFLTFLPGCGVATLGELLAVGKT
jgi:DNA polymerase-3 subunit epsilon